MNINDKRLIDLTVGELESIIGKTVQDTFLKESQKNSSNIQKHFYSPKEFAHLTGMKYSTVIYRCTVGKLKARQDDPNCSWQIHSSEIERYKKESDENIF